MTSTIFLKCLKAWQTKEPLFVLQVSPSRAMRDTGHKKAYLVLDARQDSFGVSLVFEKPALTFSSGALAEIFRKHLDGAAIGRILHHSSSGDWWLEVWQTPEACWWLKVQKSRPPELVLVNAADEALIRFGAKGTFTKKKAYEGDHPSRTEGFETRSVLVAAPAASGSSEDEPETDGLGLFSPEQRDLTRRLKRRMKTLKKSFEKDAAKTRAHDDPVRLRDEADLLRAFAHRVRPGAFELVLTPEETGRPEPVALTLDPDRSVGEEINERFERAKKARRGHEMGASRHAEFTSDMAALETDLERLTTPLTPADLQGMARRHGLLEKQKAHSVGSEPVSLPYRVYRSSLGHRLLVGKGAKDNDALTRAARANDWWLHAVGVTGSHVIVPTDKVLKDALPTATLREAAILAIHYSKFKGDMAGEVYVTRRQHLRKQKGLADGLWLIDRSETLFFRYSSEERDQVLGRQEA